MKNVVSVKAENGITFNVRRVNQGDKYGLDNCLTHKDEKPMIEFYDSRYSFHSDEHGNMLGQFISRYFLENLLFNFVTEKPRQDHEGICLDGGIPDWCMDGAALSSALNQLK